MPGCVLSSAQWPAGADPENYSLLGIADRQWGLFGSCAGSWIIQECKRTWEKGGGHIEYDRLVTLAETSAYREIIDLTHPRFSKPDDMIAELDAVVAHLYGLSESHLTHIFETFHEGWEYQPRLKAVLAHYKAWAAKA